MYAQVNATGRILRDPIYRPIPGKPYETADFTVATFLRKHRQGRNDTEVMVHRVLVTSGKMVQKIIRPHCRKGTIVQITANMEYQNWLDERGYTRRDTILVIGLLNGALNILPPDIDRSYLSADSVPDHQIPNAPLRTNEDPESPLEERIQSQNRQHQQQDMSHTQGHAQDPENNPDSDNPDPDEAGSFGPVEPESYPT